jgi:hypothetical protein
MRYPSEVTLARPWGWGMAILGAPTAELPDVDPGLGQAWIDLVSMDSVNARISAHVSAAPFTAVARRMVGQ